MKKGITCFLIAVMILFLCGCSSEETPASTVTVDPENRERESSGEDVMESRRTENETHYDIPEYQETVFSEEKAVTENGVTIDLSHVAEGYFGVHAESESRMKIRVIKEDITYTYDLPNDDTVAFYPFTVGEGTYTIQVLQNTNASKYTRRFETKVDVEMSDEFQPFLRTTYFVDYSYDDECVTKARELAEQARDANDLVTSIYELIVSSIKYDREFAKAAPQGYVPTPDTTLSTGKGICIDYAALAASMLRSQGIPTKMIFGYVAPNDVYHAWNMFYTEETGWITVEFKANEGWNRVDLTFIANGEDDEFVGNGENYADVYQY